MWTLSDGHAILALLQRKNADERTLGDVFYDYGCSLPDIEVVRALDWLLRTITGLGERFEMMAEILDTIFNKFKKTLPSSLTRLLGNAQYIRKH